MSNQETDNVLPQSFNHFGEAPLPDSPKATLKNGVTAIPQQFFHYCRTVENVETIIRLIDFSIDLPIFVFEESGHIFLQVGIVGYENYPPSKTSPSLPPNDKIVYGRRWYIEPYTPTSEVIQTAFLAINKVREHEIRELLTLSLTHKGNQRLSTPFNSHIDLPLASKNHELFNCQEEIISPFEFEKCLHQKLEKISLGHCDLILEEVTLIHKPYWLIAIKCRENKEKASQAGKAGFMRKFFPELIDETIYFTSHACISRFLHALLTAIIKKCEAHVAEHFTFDGFKRFSHHIHPDDLAAFSLDTRLIEQEQSNQFKALFSTMVHLVDGSKAPVMASSEALLDKQKSALKDRQNLEGYLPK